jgi:hypothetical protein
MKNRVVSLLFAAALLIAVHPIAADQTELEEFTEQSRSIQQRGMLVLGSWAALNVAGGGLLALTAGGATRSFALMSMGWGGVNGALALTAGSAEPPEAEIQALLKRQRLMENLFLFNAGLDVGYMFAGLWMTQLAGRSSKPDRLKGFGYSIVMQGAFLFIFDLVMFFVMHSHGQALYGQL